MDPALVLETGIIAGLSLEHLDRQDEALLLARSVATLAAENPGALDVFGNAKLDHLLTLTSPNIVHHAPGSFHTVVDLVHSAGEPR
jgi:hypothetical protein